MDYDYATIEAKMKSLPDDLQEAMVSFDTANRVQEIGKKHGLLIDQMGALADVTSYVMLGLVPGKNFVSTLMKKAELDEGTANEIAKDINSEIFDGIRDSIKKIEAQNAAGSSAQPGAANNTDLEKAGGINVEENRASEDVIRGGTKPAEQISRAATLNAIENPPAFVDRLLTGTSASVNETVVKTPTETTTSTSKTATIAAPLSQTPPKSYTVDPYREPIE